MCLPWRSFVKSNKHELGYVYFVGVFGLHVAKEQTWATMKPGPGIKLCAPSVGEAVVAEFRCMTKSNRDDVRHLLYNGETWALVNVFRYVTDGAIGKTVEGVTDYSLIVSTTDQALMNSFLMDENDA